MTPKETAERLFKRYIYIMGYYHEQDAKKYALITVDEILNVIDNFEMIYWENVKQEIEKL